MFCSTVHICICISSFISVHFSNIILIFYRKGSLFPNDKGPHHFTSDINDFAFRFLHAMICFWWNEFLLPIFLNFFYLKISNWYYYVPAFSTLTLIYIGLENNEDMGSTKNWKTVSCCSACDCMLRRGIGLLPKQIINAYQWFKMHLGQATMTFFKTFT